MNRQVPDGVKADEPVWLQIAPYGVYPGTKCPQLIDEVAVNQMVANFAGDILVDIDHNSIGGKDTSAAGWVKALRADPADGLLGEFHFTPKGIEIVAGREYRYLSPFWRIDEQDGRPVQLASVALTNVPNLPVAALKNSATLQATTRTTKEETDMNKLRELLKLEESATEDDIVAAVTALITKVTQLEEKALDAEAKTFAEANADACKDKVMMANCYKQNPEVAKAMVANMKIAEVPEKPTAKQSLFIANSAQVPDMGALPMSDADLCHAMEALPPGERKAFFAKHHR